MPPEQPNGRTSVYELAGSIYFSPVCKLSDGTFDLGPRAILLAKVSVSENWHVEPHSLPSWSLYDTYLVERLYLSDLHSFEF